MSSTLAALVSILTSLSAFAQPAPTEATLKQAAPNVPPTMEKAPGGHPSEVGSIKFAKVAFETPANGAVVTNPVSIKLSVNGMHAAKAGAVTPGAGYFVVMFADKGLPKGQKLKPAKGSVRDIELKNGETETTATLPKGKHRLTVQFFDGAGRSYGETLSQTIDLTIE